LKFNLVKVIRNKKTKANFCILGDLGEVFLKGDCFLFQYYSHKKQPVTDTRRTRTKNN